MFLAVLPNLEVFLSEIAKVVAFFIGHHCIDEYFTRLHMDDPGIGRGSRSWLLGMGYRLVGT